MAVRIAPPQVTRYAFTVVQFEKMVSEGLFAEVERLELIDGAIVELSPINHPHAAVVSNLEFMLREMLGRSGYVWAQQPVLLNEHSRPQPDVAVLKWRDARYMHTPPTTEDVLLIIEVADSSMAGDRSWKRAKYASAGVADYWIVNLQARQVEVSSEPVRGKYRQQRTAGMGDNVTLPAALGPDLALGVAEVFGSV